MVSTVVKFLILSEAFAVVTFAGGWWAVAVVGLAWGVTSAPGTRPVLWATICAATGWLSLLLLDAARGPISEVALRFGGVVKLPPFALFAVTLLFPALLAFSASAVASGIRRAFAGRKNSSVPARESESVTLPPSAEVAVADG